MRAIIKGPRWVSDVFSGGKGSKMHQDKELGGDKGRSVVAFRWGVVGLRVVLSSKRPRVT